MGVLKYWVVELLREGLCEGHRILYIKVRPCLLNQNFSWCMPWSIVGWITVIGFLCVCLGLLSSSYSLC